jgi:iron complex outermembrane recepter protein
MASRSRAWLLGVSVLALAGMSVPVLAQDTQVPETPATATSTASPTEQVALETQQEGDIIVTANKRLQNINDVGLSITAETGEALIQRGISSPTDLGKIVPGLTVQPSPFNTPVYTLRGVGFYETTLSAAPTVAVYVDEVQLPFSATTRGAAFDIERVEVLKGPQGTLFGQNTTGGAINYIAAKPTDVFAAGVDASFGRFETFDVQGFVSGPLGPTLKARLALRTIQGGAWQKSYTRDDELGQQNQFQGRFQLQWDPTDSIRLLFNANGWKDNGDTQAAQLQSDTCAVTPAPTCGSPAGIAFANYPKAPQNARAADWGYGIYRTGFNDFSAATDYSQLDYSQRGEFGRRPKRDDRFYQFSLRADVDLSEALTLTSITAYSDYKTDSVQDFDGTVFASVDTNTSGYIRDFSQELRLSATLERANIIVGGNYNKATTFDRLFYNFSQGPSSDPLYTIPGAPSGQLTFNYSDQDIEAFAVFGNVEFKLTDSVTLLGGARYTKTNRDFEGCTNDYQGGTAIWWNAIFGTNIQPGGCLTFDPNFVPFNPALFDKLNEDNISWNVGVNYKTPGDTLLYGRVSRGYKSGSFPTASVAAFTGYIPVSQESVTAYEIGVKAPLANGLFDLTAAAFYYDYKDKQLRGRKPDPVFGTLDGLVQIPKSEVKGIEVALLARPVEGLRISAGATYIDTEIKEYIGFLPDATTDDFSGQRFPFAPDLTIIGDAEYSFPLGAALNGFFGASVTYNSETSSSLANTDTDTIDRDARFDMRAYTLIDLRAGFEVPGSKVRVGAYVRNLTDEYYWTNVQDNLASVTRFAGMPRTFGIQASWRY